MIILFEAIRSALKAIQANRLRSFLTTLGIVIGVSSVIAVISLIHGLSRSVTDKFASMGATTLIIQDHTTKEDWMRGKRNYLPFEDIERLRVNIPELSAVSPRFNLPEREVRSGTRSAFGMFVATFPDYQSFEQRYTDRGRFLAVSDELGARRVAVIGSGLVDKLQLAGNPLGQHVQVGAEWLTIVGVLEDRGELMGMPLDDVMLVPFSTGRSMTGFGRPVALTIHAKVADPEQLDSIKMRVTSLLRAAHKLRPDQDNDFRVQSADFMLKELEDATAIVTVVMGGIVGIALLVGGIGIMNIMLVSVTERTREIGICKALGARPIDILAQFLVEAVVLSLLGGLIGVALGYGLGHGIAALIPKFPEAVVPWWSVVLALGFSAGVGIVFGVVPARRASRLNPIDALRYE